MIFFIIASSFFLGATIHDWINNRPLDTAQKIGLVLHPIVIILLTIRLHH